MNINAAFNRSAALIEITQRHSSAALRGTRSRQIKCVDGKIQFCASGEKHTMSGREENTQRSPALKCGKRQPCGNRGVKKSESLKAQGCKESRRASGLSSPQREYSAVAPRSLTSVGARQYSTVINGLAKSVVTQAQTYMLITSNQWHNSRSSCIASQMVKHFASHATNARIHLPTINKQHQGKL